MCAEKLFGGECCKCTISPFSLLVSESILLELVPSVNQALYSLLVLDFLTHKPNDVQMKFMAALKV